MDECSFCGVLLVDRDRYSAWHAELGRSDERTTGASLILRAYPIATDDTQPFNGGDTLTTDEYERRRAETS